MWLKKRKKKKEKKTCDGSDYDVTNRTIDVHVIECWPFNFQGFSIKG